jgi:hypothetical protein
MHKATTYATSSTFIRITKRCMSQTMESQTHIIVLSMCSYAEAVLVIEKTTKNVSKYIEPSYRSRTHLPPQPLLSMVTTSIINPSADMSCMWTKGNKKMWCLFMHVLLQQGSPNNRLEYRTQGIMQVKTIGNEPSSKFHTLSRT